MRTEAEIINYIGETLDGPSRLSCRRPKAPWLAVASGDDAAVIRGMRLGSTSGQRDVVLSCDSFLEGVHFLPSMHSPEVIGYKALARATSDLAAMGARPVFFLMTLCIPPHRTGSWLEKFSSGLARAAREFRMELIGGDTSAYPTVAIGITVGGSVQAGRALLRTGARQGDQIFVSGTLGGAQLALESLSSRPALAPPTIPRNYRERNLRPEIRLALGQWLAGEKPSRPKIASAAIDTSDGLSTDLAHLCDASSVGARIFSSQLPVLSIPRGKARNRKFSPQTPLQLALHGGEDYELLFTVPPETAKRLPSAYQGVPLTRIGEITTRPRGSKNPSIELVDATGRSCQLKPRGWDSFRRSR